jgi:hypothetical protein
MFARVRAYVPVGTPSASKQLQREPAGCLRPETASTRRRTSPWRDGLVVGVDESEKLRQGQAADVSAKAV